jgi:2-(1,2-epoxy-1,2-dihydrophenyl)acetyl-CoA isomerase
VKTSEALSRQLPADPINISRIINKKGDIMDYQFKTILVEVSDGVGIITLNRPERLNAMTLTMGEELYQAFNQMRTDPDVKVVMITGAGRAFSAGADTDQLSSDNKLDFKRGRHVGQEVRAITDIEKPVICAVNGHAVGAGAGIVLACDVIFVSEKAKFSEIFAQVGAFPDFGNLWQLPRLVGPHKAKQLCFTAEMLDGQEMYRLGIAQQIFPAEELIPKTIEFCKHLAKGPTLSYMFTKVFIDRGWGMSLEQFLDYEALGIQIINASEDMMEGVHSFMEKRPPVYKGK